MLEVLRPLSNQAKGFFKMTISHQHTNKPTNQQTKQELAQNKI
jgi:hypothetical protein